MSRKTPDADVIADRVKPLLKQKAHEIQPYGHIVKLPIALSETACKDSVENLNQLLADTIAEREQLLGGVSIAMAHDVAEMTLIAPSPRGREGVPVQISNELQVWFVASHAIDTPLVHAE
jgi:starvation-inducible DNA-binding protein